jgi:hypothetical protein
MCGKARERRTGQSQLMKYIPVFHPFGVAARSQSAPGGLVKRAQHSRTPVQPRPKGAPQMGQCGVASLGKGARHSLRDAPCLGPFVGL